MFERVQKCLGYHVALYACEMGEMGDLYLGHYKIFAHRPGSFWEHGHLAAGNLDGLSDTVERAFIQAQDHAEQKIRMLSARRLPYAGIDATTKTRSGELHARALREPFPERICDLVGLVAVEKLVIQACNFRVYASLT